MRRLPAMASCSLPSRPSSSSPGRRCAPNALNASSRRRRCTQSKRKPRQRWSIPSLWARRWWPLARARCFWRSAERGRGKRLWTWRTRQSVSRRAACCHACGAGAQRRCSKLGAARLRGGRLGARSNFRTPDGEVMKAGGPLGRHLALSQRRHMSPSPTSVPLSGCLRCQPHHARASRTAQTTCRAQRMLRPLTCGRSLVSMTNSAAKHLRRWRPTCGRRWCSSPRLRRWWRKRNPQRASCNCRWRSFRGPLAIPRRGLR
mmetsp:Transcript_91087/g.262622  ORF Transcript_91087/g.262622 Transcript_91087/m.262622 type:complete len:260 (-) Transcript_91087:1579-2358(-)